MSHFSPINPHFFQPLLPGSLASLSIPVAFFSKYIKGRHENRSATLRSDLMSSTWTVKMDGRRLTGGWEEFAVAHDYRIGDIVVFRHEGDMVFHVSAFGPSFCPLRYKGQGEVATKPRVKVKKNIETEVESVATKQKIKKNIKTDADAESSSNGFCFVVHVTFSNLRLDTLHLPKSFADKIDMHDRRCEMILMNEQGRSWSVDLRSFHTGHRKRAYIRRGWASFCHGNGQRAGTSFIFKLVSNGPTPKLLGQVGNRT